MASINKIELTEVYALELFVNSWLFPRRFLAYFPSCTGVIELVAETGDGPERLCLLVESLRITNSGKLTYEDVFPAYPVPIRENPRVFM